MPNGLVWVLIAIVALVILAAIVFVAWRSRRGRAPFEVRSIPREQAGLYEGRMEELEKMFVQQPREAVAGARVLVDDLMTRMGYPVRVNDQERLHDLRYQHRHHMERYRTGLGLRDGASTEQLRRALGSYLDMARDLLRGGEGERGASRSRRLAG
jgi:hypothetical protein